MISTRRFLVVIIAMPLFLGSISLAANEEPKPPPEAKIRIDARWVSVSPAGLQKIEVPLPKDGSFPSDQEINHLIRGIGALDDAGTMAPPAIRATMGHHESSTCLQQQA